MRIPHSQNKSFAAVSATPFSFVQRVWRHFAPQVKAQHIIFRYVSTVSTLRSQSAESCLHSFRSCYNPLFQICRSVVRSPASIRWLARPFAFVRCFFLAKWLVCLFLFPPTVSRSVYLHSPSLAKQIEREENRSSELQNLSTNSACNVLAIDVT